MRGGMILPPEWAKAGLLLTSVPSMEPNMERGLDACNHDRYKFTAISGLRFSACSGHLEQGKLFGLRLPGSKQVKLKHSLLGDLDLLDDYVVSEAILRQEPLCITYARPAVI